MQSALHYAALMTGDSFAIRILIKYGAFVNIINDEMISPLFNAVSVNNPEAAATLINFNADYKLRNADGQTAFDLIKDIEEWIKCDCFDIKMKRILKSKFYFIFLNISN
jgi:ankyrin repeat protein